MYHLAFSAAYHPIRNLGYVTEVGSSSLSSRPCYRSTPDVTAGT